MKIKYLTPAILLFICPSIHADNSFQIEAIPLPPGAIGASYPAINQSGQIAVTSFFASLNPRTDNPLGNASIWSGGQLTILPLTSSYMTGDARSINSIGAVAGDVVDPSGISHPAVWAGGALTVLDQGTFAEGIANSVNDNGQIAGNVSSSSGGAFSSNAAIWNGSTLIDLGNYGAQQASALAINNLGEVLIHTYDSVTGNNVYVRKNNVDTHITVLSGNARGAAGINDLGQTLVTGQQNDNYLWQDGSAIALSDLPNSVAAFPWELNNKGQVVGFMLDPDSRARAILWHDTIPYDLNTLIGPNTGWELQVATGINDNGAIVGIGTFQGQQEAFLLTPASSSLLAPTPEPATLSLLALAAIPVLLRRRRFPGPSPAVPCANSTGRV